MKRIALTLIILPFILSCESLVPAYEGSWVDSTSIPGWTVTLEFQLGEFSITVETYDPIRELTVSTVTSGVIRASSTTMIATITGQSFEDIELSDPELHAYLAFIGGNEYSASYDVEGDTLTISGDLITAVLNQDLLVAERA